MALNNPESPYPKESTPDEVAVHLTVFDYLDERGHNSREIRQLAPTFGKLLKRAYIEATGQVPPTVRRFVGGADRPVCSYTEADRPIFDAVYQKVVIAKKSRAA